MASQRRRGAPHAKNRGVLLDAAEQLMLEEGYAAVTSRRVASKADLKPQLVHYYFRDMDELFLAVFRRRAEEGLEYQAQILKSERPLRALWEFSTDTTNSTLIMEFAALTNHRKSIRAEVARYSEKFREAQLEVMTAIYEQYRISPEFGPPAALIVIMTGIARFLGMEDNLGFSLGHKETVAIVEAYIDQLEGEGPVSAPAIRRPD